MLCVRAAPVFSNDWRWPEVSDHHWGLHAFRKAMGCVPHSQWLCQVWRGIWAHSPPKASGAKGLQGMSRKAGENYTDQYSHTQNCCVGGRYSSRLCLFLAWRIRSCAVANAVLVTRSDWNSLTGGHCSGFLICIGITRVPCLTCRGCWGWSGTLQCNLSWGWEPEPGKQKFERSNVKPMMLERKWSSTNCIYASLGTCSRWISMSSELGELQVFYGDSVLKTLRQV